MMKPILNPDKRRYITYEDGYSLHQLVGRDDDRKFYITKCGSPIAFEEKFETFTWVPPFRFLCQLCGPLR
jgi:hypothetical protein